MFVDVSREDLRHVKMRAELNLRDTVNRGSLAGTVIKTGAKKISTEAWSMPFFDSMVRPEGLEPPTPRSVVFPDETENSGTSMDTDDSVPRP